MGAQGRRVVQVQMVMAEVNTLRDEVSDCSLYLTNFLA
jgi:hypothetical protein